MNVAEHVQMVRGMRCVVCRRHGNTGTPVEFHHVAEASGKRSDWAGVPLCFEHHRGSIGLHGMGTKAFIRMFRLPGESEYGLLVWMIEDLQKSR